MWFLKLTLKIRIYQYPKTGMICSQNTKISFEHVDLWAKIKLQVLALTNFKDPLPCLTTPLPFKSNENSLIRWTFLHLPLIHSLWQHHASFYWLFAIKCWWHVFHLQPKVQVICFLSVATSSNHTMVRLKFRSLNQLQLTYTIRLQSCAWIGW